ncbi:hypothetical protein ACVI1J_009668 [Bradyrhizobium diazoefficiens]
MRLARSALKLAAIFAAMEVMLWTFGMLSMNRGNPFRLYDINRLRGGIAANLDVERRGSPAGWPDGNFYIPRPQPPLSTPICGSAWGGSFTFSDDVADADAWPHRLSARLGCQVRNYGSDGYGLDQTLIRLRDAPNPEPLTIVAIAPPMILVDGIASWTFMDLDDGMPRARITKPRFELTKEGSTLIPRPVADVDAIFTHITSDMPSRDWTAFRFPFSLSVARAIHRKLRGPVAFNELGPTAATAEAQQLRQVAAAIIDKTAAVTRERNSRLALILLPDPTIGLDAGQQFADLRRYIDLDALACVVDPTNELRHLSPQEASTPSGHFSPAANEAIADAASRGLRACGFTS